MKNLKNIFFALLMIGFLFAGTGHALAANPVAALIQKCGNADFSKGSASVGQCGDVSIFVTLAITIGNYVFSFIGALALLFFVYGGFVLILSQGNSEKVKQGMNIIMAAGVGLVIVFSAYMLVQFLSTTLGVVPPQ